MTRDREQVHSGNGIILQTNTLNKTLKFKSKITLKIKETLICM